MEKAYLIFDENGGYDAMTAGYHVYIREPSKIYSSEDQLICTVDCGNFDGTKFDEKENAEARFYAQLLVDAINREAQYDNPTS